MRESAPGEETVGKGFVPGSQRRVHDQERRVAPGCRHRQGEPDQPARVLHDQDDVAQVEGFDEGEQRVAMEIEGIYRFVRRLVGAAKSQEIRRHDAIAGG